MKSADYWIERARQRETEAAMQGAELYDKIFQEYETAARRMAEKVQSYYAKYGDKHGLSKEEAMRVMNRPEMQEWKKSLEEYVQAIANASDPKLKARLKAELDALSYNSRITRLEGLQAQINMELNTLFDRGVAAMREEFGEMFTEGYYHKLYDLQRRSGTLAQIAKVDTRMLEDVLSYPWSGAHFSDRLWRNKDALIFSTRELLTRGVIEGQSIAQMSKDLSTLMGQSYKVSERLILTESAHFHNEGDARAYEAAGVEEYEFHARPSVKTCPVCGALDGKHFPIKEMQSGVNAPPMHPYCHCVTVEYDPEEEQDWKAIGREMPHRMTYEEWKAEQGVGEKMGDKETHNKGKTALPAREETAPRYSSTKEAFSSVKYTGISGEFAEKIDTELLHLANDYPINTGRIQIQTNASAKEFGSYGCGLQYNKGKLDMVNRLSLSNVHMKNEINSEVMHGMSADIRNAVNRNASAMATVSHEYAHAIDTAYLLEQDPGLWDDLQKWAGKQVTASDAAEINRINREIAYSNKRLSVIMKEKMMQATGSVEADFWKTVEKELGKYAVSNDSEFLAEGFSAFKNIPEQEQTEFLKEFKRTFDEEFDKVFRKRGGK